MTLYKIQAGGLAEVCTPCVLSSYEALRRQHSNAILNLKWLY